MSEVRLSYLITTFNKLKYLKITLPFLLENVREDEEIVITDGGSTDGSQEYLSGLYKDGKIHQYVSERDAGEADGFNKGILMAKGKFIKPLTDDDLFELDGIRKCVGYMLSNGEVDLMGMGGISYDSALDSYESSIASDTLLFEAYRRGKRPFAISGLGVLFRKHSISKIGLYGVNYKRVDMEFWLRSSSNRNLKMAYAPVNAYCWIANMDSNSFSTVAQKRMEMESYNLVYYFQNAYDGQFFSNPFLHLLKHNWHWFLRFKNHFLRKESKALPSYVLNDALDPKKLTGAYHKALVKLKGCTVNEPVAFVKG